MTLLVGLVLLRNEAGGDECDAGESRDKYCDPYVKFTLTDGESESQIFTTNTITNSAGFTTIDEVFYSKKLQGDKTKITMEIYDANEEDITRDDRRMFSETMSLEKFISEMEHGKPTAKVVLYGNWIPEHQPISKQ